MKRPPVEISMKRTEAEHAEKWREIGLAMPWIEFPAGWKVRVIPPFGGAMARFCVMVPGHEGWVSVYADHYCALGYMDGPYWEVYPYRGDVGRCDLEDTTELLRMIGDRSPGDEEDDATADKSGASE